MLLVQGAGLPRESHVQILGIPSKDPRETNFGRKAEVYLKAKVTLAEKQNFSLGGQSGLN